MKEKTQNEKQKKSRAWCGFVYPPEPDGGAPQNWREILQATGLQIAISPLHDKDTNEYGERKKAHWHIIIVWDKGSATFSMAKSIFDSLNSPIPQTVGSIRGNYRYFAHLDNPEKVQYDEKDIVTLNGFSIANFVDLTRSEVSEIKRRLQKMIADANIMEYSDLMDILLDSEMWNEHDVASNNTFYFNTYITSRRHKHDREERN